MHANCVWAAFATALLLSSLAGRAGAQEFVLYYHTYWQRALIKYNADNRGWTPFPGMPMSCPMNLSYSCDEWKQANVFIFSSIEFALTDGQSRWDNGNGSNYHAVQCGVYELKDRVLRPIHLPNACPGFPPCNGHGVCNSTTRRCTCASGYYGAACESSCNCMDHSHCAIDGSCVCDEYWGACTGIYCIFNLMTDAAHCGGCHHSCWSRHVKNATCVMGECHVSCETGYQPCPNATCATRC